MEKINVKLLKKWAEQAIVVQKRDRTKMKCIGIYVMLQCSFVFAVSGTVIECVWKPDDGIFELDTLARIMYLYDTNVCGKPGSLKQFQDLELSRETFGLNITPIQHKPVYVNVITNLSKKTLLYIKCSISLHVLWFLSALVLIFIAKIRDLKIIKIILLVFSIVTMVMIVFDVCMAIIYIADIQQSLTKAMIIRYSGWGTVPSQIKNPEEFGGWVPLLAAAMWLRGIIFFCLNFYLYRYVKRVMLKIKKKEVRSRLSKLCNVPFPDPNYNQKTSQNSLHFRPGEYKKF